MSDMRRREFISLLGGAAAAWPRAARAQQSAMPVIGFISGDLSRLDDRLNAFRTGLSEIGYVDGRNAAIEYRLAEGQSERLPALMDDLIRVPATIIAAGGLPAVLAAKAATTTVPIAFYVGADPVEMGIVASLNRPSGNLTGVTGLSVELVPKRLELLHEMVPTATIAALLVNPTNPNAARQTRELRAAPSGSSSMCCMRPTSATSKRSSPAWLDCKPARWLSARTDCLFATANSSAR
jgi:putative ABC transport system substrate-binding protein